MNLEYQIIIALLLDLMLGDPRRLPHPVKGMGRLALFLEPHARSRISAPRAAGVLTALAVIMLSGLSAWGVIRLAGLAHPWAADAASILLLYTCLAAQDLSRHSDAVFQALEARDLEAAKHRVSLMVGRDTQDMSQEDIVRATVESIAENTCDGVVAPLFYAFLFGAAGAVVYKAISTLDSTFGYKNEPYRDFGWFPARLDDAANYLAARLTALLIAAAALVLGMDARAAMRIRKRDGRRHASPNSGLSEAAMAGALGIQLGGPVRRKGILDPRPRMGDPVNRIAQDHILKANNLLLAATILAAATGFLLTKWIKECL